MTTSYVRGTETDLRTVKERFGGIDTPSALGGLFALIGTLAFLGALIGAGAGELSYQLNAIDIDGNLQEVEVIGLLIAGFAVLASSFVGGWVAARMARFDGVMNGVGVAIWLLLLVAVFAALGTFVGAEFNAFQRVGLPDWFSQFAADDVTAGVIVGGVVGIAALFVGAAVGGFVGDAYNRRVDAAITDRAVRSSEDL